MFHLSELDVRAAEQRRRDDSVNRHGWMRSPVDRTSRLKALAGMLDAILVRTASTSSVRQTTAIRGVLDEQATGGGARIHA